MSTLVRIENDKKIARSKGMIASTTAIGAISLGVITTSFLVGLIGLIPAAYFAYDWLRFRMDKGLRV